jgi:hypothetical protein
MLTDRAAAFADHATILSALSDGSAQVETPLTKRHCA